MNQLLAESFVEATPAGTAAALQPLDEWAQWMAATPIVPGHADTSDAAFAAAVSPDPQFLLGKAGSVAPDEWWPMFFDSCVDGQVFAAAAEEYKGDNPSYKEAIASDDRDDWQAAMGSEMDNLEIHDA